MQLGHFAQSGVLFGFNLGDGLVLFGERTRQLFPHFARFLLRLRFGVLQGFERGFLFETVLLHVAVCLFERLLHGDGALLQTVEILLQRLGLALLDAQLGARLLHFAIKRARVRSLGAGFRFRFIQLSLESVAFIRHRFESRGIDEFRYSRGQLIDASRRLLGALLPHVQIGACAFSLVLRGLEGDP